MKVTEVVAQLYEHLNRHQLFVSQNGGGMLTVHSVSNKRIEFRANGVMWYNAYSGGVIPYESVTHISSKPTKDGCILIFHLYGDGCTEIMFTRTEE